MSMTETCIMDGMTSALPIRPALAGSFFVPFMTTSHFAY